jgi:SHS2 domain-containing protein
MLKAGYTILAHPSDLGIEARGAGLAEMFGQAAAGLTSIMVDLSTVRPLETRTVALSGSDIPHLMVRWLEEVLYLFDGEGFVGKEFSISSISHTEMKAELRGEPFSPATHRTLLGVKAVTYHQLAIREGSDGAVARIFFDI